MLQRCDAPCASAPTCPTGRTASIPGVDLRRDPTCRPIGLEHYFKSDSVIFVLKINDFGMVNKTTTLQAIWSRPGARPDVSLDGSGRLLQKRFEGLFFEGQRSRDGQEDYFKGGAT